MSSRSTSSTKKSTSLKLLKCPTCYLTRVQDIESPAPRHHARFREAFPDMCSPFHSPRRPDRRGKVCLALQDLEPHRSIFYFAALPSQGDIRYAIPTSVESAYHTKVLNRGITTTDAKGNAIFYIQPPSLYWVDMNSEDSSLKQTIHPRHVHFVYWDSTKKQWAKTIHTRRFLLFLPSTAVGQCLRNKACVILQTLDYVTSSSTTCSGCPEVTPIKIDCETFSSLWSRDTIYERIMEKTGISFHSSNTETIPIFIRTKTVEQAVRINDHLHQCRYFNTFAIVSSC